MLIVLRSRTLQIQITIPGSFMDLDLDICIASSFASGSLSGVTVVSCTQPSKLEVPQPCALLVRCTYLSRQQPNIRDTVLQQLTVSRPSLTTS